jgi:hypothetical protein
LTHLHQILVGKNSRLFARQNHGAHSRCHRHREALLLVEREPARPETALELVLRGGDRLRISAGVDAATLRTVLEALRA